jgi:hypothetical protein
MTTTPAPRNADVVFDDQLSNGTKLVMTRVTLREGGFVAIVNGTADAPSNASILGSSVFLEPGTYTDVVVELDAPIRRNRTLTAVVFADTSGDRNPDEDGSDEVVAGTNGTITDTANVTVTAGATTTQESTATTTRWSTVMTTRGSNTIEMSNEQCRPNASVTVTSSARRTELPSICGSSWSSDSSAATMR